MAEGFSFNDRRRSNGLILGQSVSEAKRMPRTGVNVSNLGGAAKDNTAEVINRMRKQRMGMRRTAATGATGTQTANVSFATGRPRDPMFYWRQNNLPFDVTKEDELRKVRQFCRLLYLTHPIVSACIDIFTKFPLQGLEIDCKDEQIKSFYEDLFFDQLDYRNYLIDIGREYWITGEAWPLGSFNETLGVWDDDELLNPDDVQVEKSPFLKEPRYLIRLPETLRKVLQDRSPVWEYNALVQNYPELTAYAGEDALMPVSNMLLKQLKFKGDTFHKRGLPILMRGFRALLQEEMLNAALDAIADRLYTPLILVKLGASASDLGTEVPWIPTQDDLLDFEESMDAALAGDFRVLTSHFATDMAPVFGRENMPDLTNDFERIEDRILQVFGLSRTILQGADCLIGDTAISVRRAGKTFTMTIKEIAARINGLDGHLPGRRWRADIPTYVSYAQNGVIRQGLLGAAWYSGVKEVFELTTESGRNITASAKHPFLTPSGEFVQLGDLRVGDLVQVNVGRRDGSGRKKCNHYRQTKVHFHPFQVSDGANGKHKVPMHRLVMEAALNGLEYPEFLRIVRQDEIRAKELYFIDPQQLTVHHQDENHLNNDLGNLALMERAEHYVHHAQSDHVLEQVGSERIVSITSRGEQETYDLGMAEDPHNFLANGFVVHNSGETYAADALNRDIVTQLLTHYQRQIQDFFQDRASIVAEASEHWDYDIRGAKRYVKMEEVLEVDEETGEQSIVEQPKLLVPELKFATMNLNDEQMERQFLEGLNQMGVPVPYRNRLEGTGIDFEDMLEQRKAEQVALAIAEQETRRETYLALRDQNLPIADDLKQDFQPKAMKPQNEEMAGQDAAVPTLGATPGDYPALAPTMDDQAELDDDTEGGGPSDQATGQGSVIMMPPVESDDSDQRPDESDEQRERMPKPAHRKVAGFSYDYGQVREATLKHYVEPDNSQENPDRPQDFQPTGKFGNPRHVGMRRHVHVPRMEQLSHADENADD